jgi:CRP/FNR family transcriptional regulator, cyclic AMP receptor protein
MSREASQPIIALDEGLAACLPEAHRAHALRAATADTRTLEPGGWDAIAEYGGCESWMGLLVLEGYLLRRTTFAHETVGEIIGPGDLLRPWDHDGEYPVEGLATSWHLLAATTIALLDDGFAARIAPWPPLTVALLARTGRRARWLGLRLLVSQLHGVETRVFYLLWLLAERWGRRRDGMLRVPIRLTHQHIGEVIGAERPSVSNAVGRLRELGVHRLPGAGWEIPLDTPERIEQMLGGSGALTARR